jgi:hypothetical protein
LIKTRPTTHRAARVFRCGADADGVVLDVVATPTVVVDVDVVVDVVVVLFLVD